MKSLLILVLTSGAALGQALPDWAPAVIYQRFNYQPGISMRGSEIVKWPVALGPKPTLEQITEWKVEYDAWKAAQDKQEQIDLTNKGLARWVEHLTVRLVTKGVLQKSDIPPNVIDTINARRAIRGQFPF